MKSFEKDLRGMAFTGKHAIVAAIFAALSGSPLYASQIVQPSTFTATSLSVEDAIHRAIESNLLSKLAEAASQEARGRTLQTAASLLPQLTGSLAQSRVFKENLQVQGFSASPLIPNPVLGPFDVFDARLTLVQKLLDLNAYWNTKAASVSEQIANLQVDLAAEQVAAAAALAYIEDVRALRAVKDAESNLQLAQRLLTLTEHQHDAGLATSVDLARAQTRVAVDHQNLIQANLTAFNSDIRLKRVIGASLIESFNLPESDGQFENFTIDENNSLAQATNERVELRITSQQVLAETYDLRAAKAGFLPIISASADYGFSGNTPSSTARTGSFGGRLDFPIFSGGATRGEIETANARRSAALSRHDDVLIQVEEDVRLAMHAISAESDALAAAETRKQLAERELTLAQDRYKAGLGDNIQVVTAQASLADALQSWVDAKARYAEARVNFSVATGHGRTFHL